MDHGSLWYLEAFLVRDGCWELDYAFDERRGIILQFLGICRVGVGCECQVRKFSQYK